MRVIGGPRWWVTPQGVTLRALANSLEGGPAGAFDWSVLHAILNALPPATWTTYGDLAAVVGTGAQALGGHVQTCDDCELGYRVLDRDGRPSPGFTWGDPNRTDSQLDALAAEGIRITGDRVDPSQRLTIGQLQSLLPTG